MTSAVLLSGHDLRNLGGVLALRLRHARATAIGMTSAFVSVSGVEQMSRILPRGATIRLVAGTSLSFTHPNAITRAMSMAWEVRLASNVVGIFHPKLIVGGEAFLATGAIRRPSFLYVGSANLTAPALSVNTECGALISGADVPIDASATFEKLWAMASAVTPSLLASYTEAFTRRNRSRRADDLVDFGVTDPAEVPPTLATLRLKRKPRHAALPHDSAQTVWIGLESSTGAYSFQPEFPRRVGNLVERALEQAGVSMQYLGSGDNQRVTAEVRVLCSDDVIRPMTFTYYGNNSMWRLNIPMDVPNAAVAAADREGVAILSLDPLSGADLSLKIVLPGEEANEIVRRSYLLGTWASTSTRCYGWF